MDEVIKPEPDLQVVFAVPRPGKYFSEKFIHFINLFGNMGCIDKILEIIEKDDKMNLQLIHRCHNFKFSI